VPTRILERLPRSPAARRGGGEPGVLVVGGAVRDCLLGRTPPSSTSSWRATRSPWRAARAERWAAT
jgi:hypothetical protein